MASSSSTNHLDRESSLARLYVEMSIFRVSGRRERRPGSSGLLLSQQFKLLSTMFSKQLCLLRTLLVKQGYFFPLGIKFVLNERGDCGVLAVAPGRTAVRQRLLALSSNSSVRRHPIRFDSNGSSFRAWDENHPPHRPTYSWSLNGLRSATKSNWAHLIQLTE